MDTIIGIDLGTTNSVVGYMADDGPRLIPNALGTVLTPSVVGFDDQGKLLVGQAARELEVTCPERCASVFKRHMGTQWSRVLGEQTFTPETLSAVVLRSLKEDAETHLGHPVRRAVVTVPAYFNELQRQATLRAGEIAGLAIDRILNEPTAAALAYGYHESNGERMILVFDLGGGTFDVSIVDQIEGVIEVRSSSGEIFLGGEDFTRSMVARLLQQQGISFEHAEIESPKRVSRLMQQCEVAKRRLGKEPAVTIRLPNAEGQLPEGTPEVSVTRADFEQWTEHVLSRIETPIRRALGDANLKRADIDEVILVGGATRTRTVVEFVTRMFGQTPQCRINPDEVVAIGATIQAGLLQQHKQVEDLVSTDVAPFTLGIDVCKSIGGEQRAGYFMPIINRNTTIPVSRVQTVETIRAHQAVMHIEVYQGDHRLVKKNLFLGELTVKGIPAGPAGQKVRVRFTYDLNGVLEVETEVVETNDKSTLVITKHAQGMTEREIGDAVANMASLKTHPRDDSVNHFLLRRAERLEEELPVHLRNELHDLLVGFEESMELRDPSIIQRFQEELREFLDRHDHSDNDNEFDDPNW